MNSGEQKRRKRARHKPGLQASTLPEVRKGVREALIYIEDSLKIKGEKWEQGHLIESWIADVLTVGRQEQLRRALRGQAIVEALRLREERNEPLTEADAYLAGPAPAAEGPEEPPAPAGKIKPLPGATYPTERGRKKKRGHEAAVVPG